MLACITDDSSDRQVTMLPASGTDRRTAGTLLPGLRPFLSNRNALQDRSSTPPHIHCGPRRYLIVIILRRVVRSDYDPGQVGNPAMIVPCVSDTTSAGLLRTIFTATTAC